MPRASKDIAKRLRFDHRPRRDFFRRWYLPVGIAAGAVAAAIWAGFTARSGERQYLPGPLTTAHATFGDRCALCHESFAATPDERCERCHHPAPHSQFQARVPACRECHVEHRGPMLVSGIADQPCIACHEHLASTHQPAVAVALASFAAHPEFRPLRDGATDPGRLRFNHRIHLTSKNVLDPLTCAQCHVVSADGATMQPIRFETHCRRCHELKVKEAPQPLGNIEVPHDRPEVVRQGLRQRLAALAVERPQEIFASGAIEVLLPGRAPRGAVDDSRTLQEFQTKWVARFEDELYRPFTDPHPGSEPDPLLEANKYCFLCHIQGSDDGTGLPVVENTHLATQWLPAARFSHRAHEKMDCAVCHDKVRESRDTVAVNLPPLAVCQKCHADARTQSAGTACTLCHQYHQPVALAAAAATPGVALSPATPAPTVAFDTLLPQ